jgi:photosystem II stability/assembly factor-like uncharacterized protein
MFLLVNIPNLHGKWEVLNEGIMSGISSVDFINEDIGWLAVGEGQLLKTENGGVSWSTIPINSQWFLEKIDFINELNGWAIGRDEINNRAFILKTEDGGYNWNIKHQGDDLWYSELQVLNNSVVCVRANLLIMKTINGGSDWIDISPNISNSHLTSVRFLDPQTGLVAGEIIDNYQSQRFIARTTNGGSTWEYSIQNDYGYIYNLKFDENSSAYFQIKNWQINPGSFLCRTEDLGLTNEVVYGSDYEIDSYFLMNGQVLYLSVFDSLNNINLLHSADLGQQWENIFTYANWGIRYVNINEENKGLIICHLGEWIGGGTSSIILTNQFDHENWLTRRFSYSLNDIFFIDQYLGYIVGEYSIFHGPIGGDIFSTKDGGFTWSPDTSLSGWIRSCEFANRTTGYMMTTNLWSIYKTTNGGRNWNVIYKHNFDSTGFDFYGNDLFVTTAEDIWVAGNYWNLESGGAGIMNSKDGGLSWDLLWTYPNNAEYGYNLNSIQVVNNIGWSVGENGLIVKFVETNSFQIINYPTDLPLNEVFFSDATHGWIAGGYGYWNDFQPILLKTTNSGATWEEQRDFPYMVNEIFFMDSLKGWAVGYDQNEKGIIIATNNGGISWVVQVDQLHSPLEAIHFRSDYGWVVGTQGLILKTDDGGISWIDDSNNNVNASTFRLEQNYPNPFNPKTIINYELPITNYIDLSVYNLIGQKVATLVSQKQPAGRYQVEWDASGYASGVYIYRLSAKGKAQSVVQAKKLILLR